MIHTLWELLECYSLLRNVKSRTNDMSSIDYFIILSKIILPSELSVEKFFYAHIEIKYIEVKIAMKKKKFYVGKNPKMIVCPICYNVYHTLPFYTKIFFIDFQAFRLFQFFRNYLRGQTDR
jgi:hypothetical protein